LGEQEYETFAPIVRAARENYIDLIIVDVFSFCSFNYKNTQKV